MTTDVYVGIYVGIYRYRDTYIYIVCICTYDTYMDIQNMYVCRAMDGSYLQQVLALWRYNPEAVA